MIKITKQFSFFLIFFFIPLWLISQSNVSIRVYAYQYYLWQPNNYELIKKYPLSFEPGVSATYEIYSYLDKLGFKPAIAFYKDGVNKYAGFIKIAIHGKIISSYNHSVYIGIGPAIYIRQNWNTLINYNNDDEFKTINNLQYQFFPLSAEIEYSYKINKKTDFSLGCIMPHNNTIALTLGYKYWFKREVRNRRGCVTCPKFN